MFTESYITDFLICIVTAVGSIFMLWSLGLINKLFNFSVDTSSPNLFNQTGKASHNHRRFKTYPAPVPNTWYHIIDSDEIKPGSKKVIYVRCIGQNFVIYRTKQGEPIVFDAYCPHQGANLGVGGIITNNDTIQCPFHQWEFDKDGKLYDIPYITDKSKLCKVPCKSIKKWIAKDWCGLLCVYFHADPDEIIDEESKDDDIPKIKPQFELPAFSQNELNEKGWNLWMRKDIGHVDLTCIDWVDQSGDHGHFHTLHSKFLIPYTLIPFPAFINNLIGIRHELTTIIGNKWNEKLYGKKDSYYGDCDNKYYIYFLDKAGITWRNKVIPESKSLTKEFYIGPAIMIFYVPLKSMGLGSIKIFVTTTPTINGDGDGGSVMRIRVWLSDSSLRLRFVAWFIVGIAISQLLSDIEIMENKIRKKKPCITKKCGPYNRVNTWLKNFYSKSSKDVGKSDLDW